jgi:hypothetical protein
MLAGIEARKGGPATLTSLGRILSYDDLVAINCIPDLASFGCSSFAAWGPMTSGGTTIAGRNLDWQRMPALQGSQIVVVYPSQADEMRLGWVSITWPGYIGCLTGMNDEGVTVSMHDVSAPPPTVQTGFTPRGLALREAIESAHAATAVRDVARTLRSRTCAVGNNVAVSMPRASAGPASTVFEYDGFLTRTQGVTVRASADRPYQVCTNHYVERARPTTCWRYEKIQSRLAEYAAQQETLDIQRAWKILRSVAQPRGADSTLLTYQSVVFEPDKRRMYVAVSRKGKSAPHSKAVTLDVADLLN